MKFVRPVVDTVGGVTGRVKDLNRLQQVARVLISHGLGMLVAGLDIPGLGRIDRTAYASTPERASAAIQELGPTFVKLGQVLSTRPEILPPEYIAAFEKLQDDVAPIPFAEIEAHLTDTFGPEWRSRVSVFEDTPLATASIAQVHRAQLHDGRRVVFKIQRRGIVAQIKSDLRILDILVRRVLEELPEARAFDPQGVLKEFETSIMAELDFLKEAQHMRAFAHNFAAVDYVRIPSVVSEFTTAEVLCMDFLEGIPIRKAREAGMDMQLVGSRYLTVAYDMLFTHGLFHGDLHPGNVLVLEDGVLGLLDFGMVGRLTREMRNRVLTIIVAVERGDYRTVARIVYDIAIKEERVDYRAVERDTIEVIQRCLGEVVSMQDIRIGLLVSELATRAARHGAVIPQDYTMFFKALLTTEGLAKSLLHEQNPITAARPYFERMIRDSVSPQRVEEESFYQVMLVSSLVERLPGTVSQLLEDVENQRLTVTVRQQESDRQRRMEERRLNRLIIAALAITLLLCGSLAINESYLIGGLFYMGGFPLLLSTVWTILRSRS